MQNGAVVAQPVSSLALRLKGVYIDDIAVVTFQARSAGDYIFPINALPGKAVSPCSGGTWPESHTDLCLFPALPLASCVLGEVITLV